MNLQIDKVWFKCFTSGKLSCCFKGENPFAYGKCYYAKLSLDRDIKSDKLIRIATNNIFIFKVPGNFDPSKYILVQMSIKNKI